MNVFISLILFLFVFLALPLSVFAHVVIKPSEVGVGAFQTFTVGVPNEKEVATTQVRVVIPDGVGHVSPNVKPGWTITTVKQDQLDQTTDEHAENRVLEIVWSNGEIPAGQRDDFLFSAQVPAQGTTLTWKAYQTYADGTVVSWDQEKETDEENNGPASKTTIINDIEASIEGESKEKSATSSTESLPILISLIALGVSLFALWKLMNIPASASKK